MKPSKCFSLKYRALDKLFAENYNDILQKKNPDDIHRLRVTIKKTSAFFHLLAQSSGRFDAAGAFRPYKKIFKRAGKVRDLQIRQMLLSKLGKELKLSVSLQLKKMKEEEEEENNSLRKYCSKQHLHFHNSIKKEVVHAIRKDFSAAKAAHCLRRQLKRLKKLTAHSHEDSGNLHKLRILLKDYIYNIDMLNECVMKDKVITQHIAILNNLQNLIGKWHDEVMMLRFASDYKHLKRFSPEEIRAKRLLQGRLYKSTHQLAQELRKRFPPLHDGFRIIEKALLDAC